MTHGAPSSSADVSCAQHLSHLGEAVDAWQGYAQGYAHGKMYISILFRRNRVEIQMQKSLRCRENWWVACLRYLRTEFATRKHDNPEVTRRGRSTCWHHVRTWVTRKRDNYKNIIRKEKYKYEDSRTTEIHMHLRRFLDRSSFDFYISHDIIKYILYFK